MNYTNLSVEAGKNGAIVKRDFHYVATIAPGWKAMFYGKHIVLTHPHHQPRLVWTESVNEGDVLPRETDERL